MTPSLAIRTTLWVWLVVALLAGRQLWLQRLPTPAIPGLLAGLTALVLFACRALPAVRTWVAALNLRALVLLHTVRFAGLYFLLLYDRGELPYSLAVPGGLGHAAVAVLALLAALVPWPGSARRHVFFVWNVVGFVDLLLWAGTVVRLGITAPDSLRALTHLPLSLLPTFAVPLLLASHLVIFNRLRGEAQ